MAITTTAGTSGAAQALIDSVNGTATTKAKSTTADAQDQTFFSIGLIHSRIHFF